MIDKDKLKDYPRPDWLPDWTDPDGYPDHGENVSAWAWEFLRRNPEYQADYAHYMSIPWCYPEGGKTPKLAGRTYNDEAEMLYFYADPPAARPTETVGEYRRRTGVDPEKLEPALLKRWGVAELLDPSSEVAPNAVLDIPPYQLEPAAWDSVFVAYVNDSRVAREKQHPREWPGRNVILHDDWAEDDDGFMQVLAFDLRRPLGGQMERARMLLEDAVQWLQNAGGDDALWGPGGPMKVSNVTMPRQGKLLEYLQAYDAVWTVGLDRREIARKIFPGGISVDDRSGLSAFDYAIDKAIELVDDGYRDLLRWACFPKNTKNAGAKMRDKKDPVSKKIPKTRKKTP